MGEIIAVWGSPNCGKTTFSIKLAKELSEQNKSVIILFSDILAPPIPTLKQFSNSEKSLGNILSSVDITKDLVLKNCVSINKVKNIALLGYAEYENGFTYVKYREESILELFNILRDLVDYVIIDTSSNFINDAITISALRDSDKVIRLTDSTKKSISYYKSNLSLLVGSDFSVDNHIKILSMFKTSDEVNKIREDNKIYEEIEYMEEIREQSLSDELFFSLSIKNEAKLKNKLLNIISIIDYEDVEETGVKEGIFSKINIFNKLKMKGI